MRTIRMLFEEGIFLFTLSIFLTTTGAAQAVGDSNFTGAVDVGVPWSANYSITNSPERTSLTKNLTQLLKCAFSNKNFTPTITITDIRNLTGNVTTYFDLTFINITVKHVEVVSALNGLKNNTNCSEGNYILNNILLNETTPFTNSESTLGISSFSLLTIVSVMPTFTVQNNSTIRPSSLSTPIAVQISTVNTSLVVPTSSQLTTSFLFLSQNVTQYSSETPTSVVTLATSVIIPSFSIVSSSFVTMTFASLSLSSIPASSPTAHIETSLTFLPTTAHLSSAMLLTSLPMSPSTSSLTDNIKHTASTYAVLPTASSFFTESLSPITSVLHSYVLSETVLLPSSKVLPSTVHTLSTISTFLASSITPHESSVLATTSMSALASFMSLSILPTSNIVTSYLPTSSVHMTIDSRTTIISTPLIQTVSTLPMSTLTSVSYLHESISPTSLTDKTSITAMSPFFSTALFASSNALNSSSKSLMMSEMTIAFVSTSSAASSSILHSSSEVIKISSMVNSSLLTLATIVPTAPTLLSPVDTISTSIVVQVTPIITSSLLTTTNASLSQTLTSSINAIPSSVISQIISSSFSESSVSVHTSSVMSSFSMTPLPISTNYWTLYEITPPVSLSKTFASSMTSSSIGTFSTIAMPSISMHANQSAPTLSFSQAFSTVSRSSSLFSPIVSFVSSSIVSTLLPSTSNIGQSSAIANLSNVSTTSFIHISIESTTVSKSSIIATSYLINSTTLQSEAVPVRTGLSMVLSPSASSESHLNLKSDLTSSEFHTLSLATTHSDVISSYNPTPGIELSSTHTPSLILSTGSLTSSVVTSLYLNSSLFFDTRVSKWSVITTDTIHASLSISVSSASQYSVLSPVVASSAVTSLLEVSSSTIVDAPINSFVTPTSVFSTDTVTRTIQPSAISTLATEVIVPSVSTLSSFALSSQHVTSVNVSTSSAVTSQHWYSSSIMTTPVPVPTSSIKSSLLSSSVFTTSVLQTNFTVASTIASPYLSSTPVISTVAESFKSFPLILPSQTTSYVNFTSVVSSNVILLTLTSVLQTNMFPSSMQTSSIFTSLTHASSFVMTTPNATLLSLMASTIALASYSSSLFDIVSTFISTTQTPTAAVIQTFSNFSTHVAPMPSNIFTSANVSSNWISIVPTSTIGITSAAVNTTIVPTMFLSSSSITSSQLGYTSTLILSPTTILTMTILSDVPTIISTEATVNHTYVPTTPSIPMTTIVTTSISPISNTSLLGYTKTLSTFASTITTLIPLSVVPTINSSEMTFMHTFASTTGSSIQTSMGSTTSITPISNISLDLTAPSVSSSFVTLISDIASSKGLNSTSSLQSLSLSAIETSMSLVSTSSVNSSILIPTTTNFLTSSEQKNTVETTYTKPTTSILQTNVVASSIEPTYSVVNQPTDLLSSTVTVTYSTSPTSESVTSSSPSSTFTTAAPPTIQVKLIFSINETWNPDLADAGSQQYVALKIKVEKELTAAWQRSALKRNFNRVVSISFSSGSVVINSVLEFNEDQGQTIAADVVKKSFIDAVNSTQLGNLTIINNTVTAEILSTKTEPQPISTAQLPNWGIAVIVCGGAVLIFLLTLICILCRRRHVTHKYALTEDPDDIGYRRSWATSGVEYNPYVYDNKLTINDEDLAEQVEIKNATVVVTPYVEDTNERRHIKSALPDPFIDKSSHYPSWPPVNGSANRAARDHYDNTRTFYDQETDTWETPM